MLFRSGWHDSFDILAWIKFLNEEVKAEEILLFGIAGVEDDVVGGDLPQRHLAESTEGPKEGPGGGGTHGFKPKWLILRRVGAGKPGQAGRAAPTCKADRG